MHFAALLNSYLKDQNELQSLYNSEPVGKNVLLLLDYANDRKQVELLLSPKSCVVIFISRKKLTLPGIPEPFLPDTLKPSRPRDLLPKNLPARCRMAGIEADALRFALEKLF